MKEINYCLTSSCDCLSFSTLPFESIQEEKPDSETGTVFYIRGASIAFQSASIRQKSDCEACTVDTPTGTLSVNTEINIEGYWQSPRNCSLIFQWNSKAKSLSAPDKLLLQKPQPLSSVPIYVDFLPALESVKQTPSGAEYEHEYFIVPKECNVCKGNDEQLKWRKSWCRAELDAFTKEMSDKHRRCYQIMKYVTKRGCAVLSDYHIKSLVLCHHTTCSDTSHDCVECVFTIYRDLLRAYTRFELMSHQSNLNILNDVVRISTTGDCEILFDKLCSVSETDTWDIFVKKILHSGRTAPNEYLIPGRGVESDSETPEIIYSRTQNNRILPDNGDDLDLPVIYY